MRSQFTKARALAGAPAKELLVTHGTKKKNHAAANLRRVWKTQEEKDRDASLRATWKREGVNVNVLQAQ